MRIRQLASAPDRDRTYRAGAWSRSAIDDVDGKVRGRVGLYHYSTLMATWHPDDPRGTFVPVSVGWGSVSDQGGMNQVMRQLGVDLYYVRKGGADYV